MYGDYIPEYDGWAANTLPELPAPLLTVLIHESGELDQTFLGVIRTDARRGSRG